MRGTGHLILGSPGVRPDVDAPLPPVVAFGAFEYGEGEISIAVHEKTDAQIHVELMATPGDDLSAFRTLLRRWTYSTWSPGMVSPRSGTGVREVGISPVDTFVLSGDDRRLWLYDSVRGMNRLIPITTFYGELMTVTQTRDPAIVLRPSRFFDELSSYDDEALRNAFLAYNKIHPKTEVGPEVNAARARRSSLLYRFLKIGLGQ
jgi:hypothetical protein